MNAGMSVANKALILKKTLIDKQFTWKKIILELKPSAYKNSSAETPKVEIRHISATQIKCCKHDVSYNLEIS